MVAKPVKKKNSKSTKIVENIDRSIDVERALKLRIKNRLSFSEIGEQLGVTKQAVQQRLRAFTSYIQDPDIIAAYDSSKPEILSSIEMNLAKLLLDAQKQKGASLNNVAYALGQVHGINRLERNLSTNNSVNLNVEITDTRYKQFAGLSNVNKDSTNDNK